MPKHTEVNSDPKDEEEEETRCPECGSTGYVRDYKRGDIVCSKCQLVIEDRIMDQGPEWGTFNGEQLAARERAGPPMTYMIHDKELSTQINPRDYDAHGSALPPQRRRQIHRLRRWHNRSTISKGADSNLSYAVSEMDRRASQLHLPRNLREASSIIYRDASQGLDKEQVD